MYQAVLRRKRSMKHYLFLPIALAATLCGCFPSIGDKCESSTECPTGAVCDITVADGYCLVQDCAPNECPPNSICVPFDDDATFCLRFCESDKDCRKGHDCLDGPDGLGYCYEN